MWKNADIPKSDVHPPLIEPSATELYYTMSVWYAEECRYTQVRCNLHPGNQTQSYRVLLHHVSLTCARMQTYPGQMYPLLIKPNATEPYYTMSVWHVEECRHTQVRWTPPLIEPSFKEPYYTMSVWHVEECRHTQVWCNLHPGNQTQSYRVLLHHVSLTCARMQTYPGQMYTPC